MPATMANVTISIPKRLVVFVEQIVKESKTNTNRSKVISQCLEDMAEKRMIGLMEEGYREMADENMRLAEQSLPIVSETWPS